MFDEKKFRAVLALKGKTVGDVAKALGISKSALYRKMNGTSDFYRSEIQKCCEFLEVDDLSDVFFA